ncbi:MAG: ABC transporter permease [Alphaproteobacteria bacterium]
MRFLGRKLLRLVFVVIAVTTLTFLLVSLLPGDVAYLIAGLDASPAEIDAIRAELGLDQPLHLRYLDWVAGLLQGDLGISLRTSEPVGEAILSRLPVTLELMFLAQVIAVGVAVPLGVLCAYRQNRWVDQAVTLLGFAMISIPPFVMALILIFFFALRLGILPATGYTPLSEGLWDNLRTFILPALSIALIEWVTLMRLLRNDMIVTLQEDYIAMARAKGLPTWHILLRHALRPSSFSLITILGIQVGALIGGTLIIETLFALPGVGRLLLIGIFSRDYVVVQGCILFIAVSYVMINFLVDLTYSMLDPRIRVEGRGG